MGRRSITGETIVVAIDDNILVWTDGQLSGTNNEMVKKAKFLSKYEIEVDLSPFGPTVYAGLDNSDFPERACAAMVGVNPGRARILQAPQNVRMMLPFDSEDDLPDELVDILEENPQP